MDAVERFIQNAALWLSRVLVPVTQLIDRVNFAVLLQLDHLGVPTPWRGRLLAALWVVTLFMILRTLPGWWRVALLVGIVLVLGQTYGMISD